MPEAGWSSVPSQAKGPFGLNDDRVDAERMIAEIEDLAQPRVSRPFRPRFGYLKNTPGIVDVIHIDERWQTPPPVDHYYQDTYGQYSGTQTPGWSNDLGKP